MSNITAQRTLRFSEKRRGGHAKVQATGNAAEKA